MESTVRMSEWVFTVKLFASLKELAGQSMLTVKLSQADPPMVADLRRAIAEQHAALAPALPSAIAAVNQDFAEDAQPITPTDEIAFFPPVSGGAAFPEYFALTEGAVDLNAVTARIVTPATGAVALFSGFVRGQTHTDGALRETLRLEYEAYEAMAMAKMRQVAAEIREQWSGVQGIAIVQSVGVLHVGQPTVLIACAAAHRNGGCFEAARYGIDRLKEIVPVWKKEVGRDGQTWIEGDYTPSRADRAPE